MKFIYRHKQSMYKAILLFAWEADTLSIIVVRQAGAIPESEPSLLVILLLGCRKNLNDHGLIFIPV